MHATFYGGPADGGVLILAEPIRTCLHFPMTPAQALEVLDLRHETSREPLVPNHVPAMYALEMVAPDRPYRDTLGRVRYLYVLPTPSTEGTDNE